MTDTMLSLSDTLVSLVDTHVVNLKTVPYERSNLKNSR